MKRYFLPLLFTIISILTATAQEPQGKLNVFVDYFDRTGSTPFIWAETVRNHVMEGIQATNRVNLIDVDSRGTLAIEEDRRREENTVAGDDLDRLKVMTQEGANLLVKGVITDISVTPLVDTKGSQYGYKSTISLTLKVIDPANGTTVLTKNYRFPKNDLLEVPSLNTPKTEDDAVQDRAKSIVKPMKKFVEEAFPTVGKIIELDDIKNGVANAAYINLGKNNGMAPKAKFEIRVKRLIGGSVSYKLLGECEVMDVESDDLSKVKINKKGAQEVTEAFKAGQELIIRSLNK